MAATAHSCASTPVPYPTAALGNNDSNTKQNLWTPQPEAAAKNKELPQMQAHSNTTDADQTQTKHPVKPFFQTQ
jgi:hypothetical protein